MKQSQKNRLALSGWGSLLLFLLTASMLAFRLDLPMPVMAAPAAEAAGCYGGSFCNYLPALMKVTPPAGDLVLGGIEITQAVQDSSNSVPMVAGRKTVLRVYGRSADTSKPLSNVKVLVTAARSGVVLSGSPRSFSATMPMSSDPYNYQSSVNVILPDEWLNGTIDLTIQLDPDNSIDETNETNNVFTQRVVFEPMPALKVMIVPVKYTHTPNGITYRAPTTDTISSWINRAFPISEIEVTWHPEYAFTGNLRDSNEFIRLLHLVDGLKDSENAPANVVYYGLIPTSDGGASWFSGGVAGVGYVGSRTSIGLNTASSAGQIAAHEIGHNLGMSHTPCGSATGTDPAYPYLDGSIGGFGLDVETGTVYSPSVAKDLMTYCNPKWISDYTYKFLFNSQKRSASFMAASSVPLPGDYHHSLMVRAQVSSDGAALLPAYVIPGQPSSSSEAGEYTVRVFGAQGEVIAQAAVRGFAVEEGDRPLTSITARIPLPDQPASKLQLMKDGQVIAEQSLAAAGASLSTSVEATSGGYSVKWDAQAGPVLVRYSSEGQQPITLAVDAAGGSLFVAAESLPVQGGTFEVLPANTWNE